MQLSDLAATSRQVAETTARRKKEGLLAECLARMSPEAVEVALPMLCGDIRQGRIGLGWAAVRDARPDHAAERPTLTVFDVDAAFEHIAGTTGPGSVAARMSDLRELLSRATAEEQHFLVRLILGEMRHGALEGVMVEAVARAANVAASAVRRAVMLSGDLAAVARAALADRGAGLDRFRLELFVPVQPMLAQTAAEIDDVASRLGQVALEHKLDGARIQVHRAGDEVRVFTRQSNEVTARLPEVVEAARALPVTQVVLDGEAISLAAGGGPEPFQSTMQRFGRKRGIEGARAARSLSPFFFDCLHLDGEDLLDRPQVERFAVVDRVVPAPMRIERVVPASLDEARAFLDAALASGQEGAMLKALDAPYEAGRRGASWLKLKRAQTLDLVVLAAEWGSGRRRGWLSNLHLGARDAAGSFVMLGKTFKGLTDATLEWQTHRLQELEITRDQWTVHVRPELVVEIAFDGLQESSRYPGGLALRFARVKRYRPDKSAAQADTIDMVRAIHARQGTPSLDRR